MPSVTYKKPNPLEVGLSGLEGALAGKERGMIQQEGVRQFDVTTAENTRQFDEDMGFRINQLEVLQEQNQLDREQQARLEKMKEQYQTYRTGAELGSQEKRTQWSEEAETARNKVRAAVDYTRIREAAKTDTEQLGLQRQQLHGDPMQRISAAESVISRFEGGYDGFLMASPQEQQAAVESLAAERSGQDRWAGSSNVRPMTDVERQQALDDARRDLYGYKELRQTTSDRAIEFETARAQAQFNIEQGGSATGSQVKQTYLSEVMQEGQMASVETGLYPLDPSKTQSLLGSANYVDVLAPVDMMIADAVEKGLELRKTGAVNQGQIQDEWERRWADIDKRFRAGFRTDTVTYNRFLKRANMGLTQALYSAYPEAGYTDPDAYIELSQSGADMSVIDAMIEAQTGGAEQLLELQSALEQDKASQEQLKLSRKGR